MANETIAYNRQDLRDVLKAFKAMDDQATEEARTQSAALAYFASQEIKATAATRTKSGKAVQRVADGVSISKSSKIGEFSYGFARQKFSGGATTQSLWYESDTGDLKVYYDDGTSAQWVSANGADSLVQISGSAPSGAQSGDLG